MGSSKTCASSKRILLSNSSCITSSPRCRYQHVRAFFLTLWPRLNLLALIITGDFNPLDVTRLKRHFHLKQIVKAPTRKDAILDLVITNLHDHYEEPQAFPPVGPSDHNDYTVSPLVRKPGTAHEKFILKRDLQPSRKAEMERHLCSLGWPLLLSSLETYDELLCFFEQVILTGLDPLMPVRKVHMNTRDAPWMTQRLKDLIRKR